MGALAAQNTVVVLCSQNFTYFCRLKGLASWEVVATDAEFWNWMLPEFLAFNLPNVLSSKYSVRSMFVPFTSVPATGCPIWHAGLTLTLTLWFSTFVTVCLRSEKAKQATLQLPRFLFHCRSF